VSEFLSRFGLNIYHKPGRANIVLDTLSRLTIEPKPVDTKDRELDSLYVYCYITTLVQIAPSFRDTLLTGYTSNPKFEKLICTVRANDELGDNTAILPFEIDNSLLFCHSVDGYPQ
jgi:hypothetical protein